MILIEHSIEDIALSIKTGTTPPTSNPQYFNGEINWLTPSDLKGQKYVISSDRKISNLAIEDKKAFLFEPETIVISTIGDIAKSCIIKEPTASNQQLTGIKVNKNIILPELFYYWIQRSKNLLENKANKAIISILSNKLLRKIKISFPESINEQIKIVSRLNKIQELIDKRIETIRLLEELVQSDFLERFGDPVIDNFQIGKKDLSFFGDWKSGGTPLRSKSEYFNGEIPWYTSGELNNIFISESNENITEDAIKTTSAQLIKKGSLLIGMYDTAALKTSITLVESSCNQAIAFSNLNEELCEPIFVYYNIILSKNFYLNQRKGARQKNLNLRKIKNIEILYPEKKDQKLFVDKFEKIQLLKQRQQQSLQFLETMFQISLQNAFSENVQFSEEEIFEDLLKNLSSFDLKQGRRLQYLINWLDKEKQKFTNFDNYKLGLEKVLELLEDGSIEQVLEKGTIKLRVRK